MANITDEQQECRTRLAAPRVLPIHFVGRDACPAAGDGSEPDRDVRGFADDQRCTISAAPIAAQGVLSSPVTRKGLVAVTCTNPPPYNVAIDQGAGAPVAATNRLTTGPASATVGSGLYQVTVSF